MAAKITRDIVESRLHCKFKAHLKLAGEDGNKCDYERLVVESRAGVRLKAVVGILAGRTQEEVLREVPLTAEILRRESAYVLDALLEDDALSLRFDGLKKVEGASRLGDFHYVPVLFHERRKVGKEQRLLLELYGLLLSRIQGKAPAYGIIFHGPDCKAARMKLNPDQRKANQFLRDLTEMAAGAASPKLLLNDHCQMCEFRRRCHEQAVKEDNLSLLRGMSEKEVKKHIRKGILTVAQFAHTFRPRRRSKRQEKKAHPRYHALQAFAIQNNKIHVFGKPETPSSPIQVYLDVESDPEEGYVYLIGMIVVRDGAETNHSFWADTKEQESEILEQFLAEVGQHEDFRVFCYGSHERDFLKRMLKAATNETEVERVLERLVNVLSLVYGHVYFPTYSNGLKDVAACLGCRWTEPDASGIQSIVWRKRWEANRDGQWKQILLTYNQEDCAALRRVTGFLCALQSANTLPGNPGGEDQAASTAARVEDLKPHSTRRTWCTATFLIPEFTEINECAYFDYQRDKVFVRTSKTLARASRRRKKDKGPSRVPIDKYIDLTAKECPDCQSKEILTSERGGRRKILYDLTFSSRGITRRVIQCTARLGHCAQCNAILVPEKIDRVSKFQHGLRSWAVFEHVTHRVSFEKIRATLYDYFGFRFDNASVSKVKDLMARHYQSGYDNLLKRIIAGNLIHADETTIKTKTEEGYVWAFTTLEEVIYLYKPTREGAFLHDLLKGFTGVLVSDFFSGYDSLPCPQQKCLIHLMRDLNHDLFHSPYDEELKAVASQFGRLLKSIIQTVDKHGLRSACLARHKSAVNSFFTALSESHYTSEVALGYQARFLKNQGKLFTFLDHDGVPWNNNNAEHAIKQFAYYRQICEPHITVAGLQEYLVLLSIAQTCKYKGVSFLKFLLSRELDIDTFCKRPRKRPLVESPDFYPPGFSFRRFGDRKIYED